MSYDCYCEYEQPELHTTLIRKARKQYKCDECRGLICPGDKYETARALWEGEFSSYRTCQHCVDLRTWVSNNIPCFCWAYTNLQEDCHEAISDARDRAPEETRGLHFGFLRRIVIRDKFNKARQAA